MSSVYSVFKSGGLAATRGLRRLRFHQIEEMNLPRFIPSHNDFSTGRTS